jgi:hypothetical protein
MTYLELDDIFTIKEGMRVNATVPIKWVYDNCPNSSRIDSCTVTVSGRFAYLVGKYRVTHVAHEGGLSVLWRSAARHVYAQKINNPIKGERIDFYQTRGRQPLIENIKAINHK